MSVGAEVTTGGRLYQRQLPVTGNVRSPTVDRDHHHNHHFSSPGQGHQVKVTGKSSLLVYFMVKRYQQLNANLNYTLVGYISCRPSGFHMLGYVLVRIWGRVRQRTIMRKSTSFHVHMHNVVGTFHAGV